MQYILSEEEYKALKAEQSYQMSLSKDKLQKLCTKIADTMPVSVAWIEGGPQPWKCVYSVDYEWYCDECPVRTICPGAKHWSK